ncbi:MAG: hypothetical protein LC658_05920, partial [Bacteroidales bacterium]|nr:hypothetical protein [Bacteroidales bacterium]
ARTEGLAGDYDFMLRVMTDPEMHLHYLPACPTVTFCILILSFPCAQCALKNRKKGKNYIFNCQNQGSLY